MKKNQNNNLEQELKKLEEELKKELESLDIEYDGTLSNSSNKKYWDIEQKYKSKFKALKDKYSIQN